MFSQRFSPTTGKMEWVVEDEDYDMRNEIARQENQVTLHSGAVNSRIHVVCVLARDSCKINFYLFFLPRSAYTDMLHDDERVYIH